MNRLRHIAALFRRRKLESDMSEEMRLHLEQRTRENIAAGMSPEEARYAALRRFGGVEQAKEIAREQRPWRWFDQLSQDLRYAVRALRKNPSFTLTAVLTLAFGIGVNAALFTLYNAVALRPLPVREPESLVTLRSRGGQGRTFSYVEFLEYRESNRSLSGLAAWWDNVMKLGDETSPAPDRMFDLRGREFSGSAGMVSVQLVSDNYFTVLGADLTLGRGFLPDENRAAGANPVIVLSHLFWTRHFHRDPNVLGTGVVLDGKPFTVIGVTAPEFIGHQPAPPAGWIPVTMIAWPRALTARDITPFGLIGRLKPGVSDQQAKADLDLIAGRLPRRSPSERGKYSVQLERGMKFQSIPLNDRTMAVFAPIMMGFLLVLVIACTNVANLLLARGVTRQQEIGVRLTLGASRGRMIRQLLTENLLLCALGAVAGLTLARWTLTIVLSQIPPEWGHAGEIRQWQFLDFGIDYRVAVFTVLLTLTAAIAAGLVPALHASRANLISALKDESSAFGRRLSQSRLRNILVVVQVAVCLMLLSCAGLLVRNLIGLRHLDLGFDPRSVYRLFAGPKVALADQRSQEVAIRQATELLQTIPGVTSACWAIGGPIGTMKGSMTTSATVPGSRDANFAHQGLRYALVSGGFFETFGIPLQRGRTFTSREVETGTNVVIVGEAAARRLWPGEESLGKTLAVSENAFAWPPSPRRGARECEVIGIARDLRSELTDPEPLALYLPLSPTIGTSGAYMIRPRSDSAAALAEIKRLSDEAGITVEIFGRLSVRLEEGFQPFIVLAWISGALGTLALLMASVGLYGVMSFAVNQRVREIGIRLALGATAEKVIGLFVRQGMRLVAVGIVIGLVGGGLFALVLAKIMFGLGGAFDPVTFGGVTLVLAAVAFAACWIPTRRAARVDPMVALRCE